jgi:hypothetical protein
MGTQQFTRKELATSENGSNKKTSFVSLANLDQ